MGFDWTKYQGDSGYVRWNAPGQVVEGVIRRIDVGSFMNKEYPELTIDDVILSASHVNLQRQLVEEQPDVGDDIRIEYLGEDDAKPGKNPMKRFRVDVRRADMQIREANMQIREANTQIRKTPAANIRDLA